MLNGLGNIGAMGQSSTEAASQSSGPNDRMGKQEFLQLLVTQLGNQDPMNPMDGQQFAAQLAQFTSVEQLVNIGDVLAQNGEMNGILAQSVNSGVAAGLIGKSVEASGNSFNWSGDGVSTLNFDLDSTAANVKITIRDSAGVSVREIEVGGRPGGKQTFEWDGSTRSGLPAASGTYTFDISATDSAGDAVEAATFTAGIVDRVTFGKNGIQLWLGEHSVPMSGVSSVE